ncbi:helix-turn-helix domain-containing protein [Microcoleus sp. FACHB-1515]|nr:helix-turn-helix domain-containing protein [Microcoleus sp. FACHB-1515]
MSPHFARVANLVTGRVSELLFAPVCVTNDRGIVITSSDRDQIGSTSDQVSQFLRVPFRLQAQTGEVIVGEPSGDEAISPRLAQVLVELVIHQTTGQARSIYSPEVKHQFLADLLHGRLSDEVAIDQAKPLGIDLSPPRAVILIDAANFVLAGGNSETERRRAQLVIGSVVSFFHLPSDTICADLGEGKVAVLKASDSKNLELWADCPPSGECTSSWTNLTALRRAADALLLRLRNDTRAAISVGIGRYHPGVRGLARSYQDAQAALSLGSRFQGCNQVYCLGRLGIAAFVGIADERTKIELARYLLSPLDHEPDLLTTLNAFFTEDCCPSTTAKRLSIHRNTLSYRLEKITSLTGLEPRRFDDAVQMRLALVLRSLAEVQPVSSL